MTGCNRGAKDSCPWCDTEFSLRRGRAVSFEELVERIYQRWRGTLGLNAEIYPPFVVLTGGEPSLQAGAIAQFMEFAEDWAEQRGYAPPVYQFESNGDYYLDLVNAVAMPHRDVNVVISPKAHPTVGYADNIPEQIVHSLEEADSGLDVNTYFRMVVSADEADSYHQLPEWIDQIRPNYVPYFNFYITPIAVYDRPISPTEITNAWVDGLGVDRAATAANYKYASLMAKEHQMRLSIQSHLFFAVE